MEQSASTCPRCGYDLSGHLAAREADGSIHGRCSECGFDFRWESLLRDDLHPPSWSFEHAPLRRLPLALLGTSARMFMPHLLLQNMTIWLQVRAYRILLLLITWISVILVWFWTAKTAVWMSDGESFYEAIRRSTPGVWIDYFPALFPAIVTISTIMPVSFLRLHSTLRLAKVGPDHLLRLGVLGCFGSFVLWSAWLGIAFSRDIWFEAYDIARFFERNQLALVLIWFAWFVWFWWLAISRYLRLPHALPVLCSLLLVSTLCGVLAQVVVAFLTGEWVFLQLRHGWPGRWW